MIEAFLDKKDYIKIISDKESPLYINGDVLPVVNSYRENDKHVFISNYKVILGQENIITNKYEESTILNIRYYAKTLEFDDEFYYSGNDLGANYTNSFTVFKLWAPIATSVRLLLHHHRKIMSYSMERKEKGVYEIKVKGDLKNCSYNYEVINNGVTNIINDPYAYSGDANSAHSAVIDINEYKASDYHLKDVKSLNDAIIYELSVRDFSSALSAIDKKNQMKFNAFSFENLHDEYNNPLGLDYLKSLGITHIQLLPILDFATVDELNQTDSYNWGYDPVCYNVLEGSYSIEPNNPTKRMEEFIALVNKLHENKLRVVLDVVFNHTYFYKESLYEKQVPNYFYLIDTNNGNVSNGSFCGCDIDTTRKMSRKYFMDMAERLVNIYKIDGFRYDLMGIIDISLIRDMYYMCKKVNPSFVAYGEGWDTPTFLPNEKRCSLINANEIKEVAFFNNYFRNVVSGQYYSKDNYYGGYLAGNLFYANEFIKAMCGSTNKDCYFENALSSINYVECHDRQTIKDKLKLINPTCSDDVLNKMNLMCMAATIFALGTPFIQAGQEFLRTKDFDDNSYKSPDSINKIDWSLVETNKANIKAFKDFIRIRKEYPCFKLSKRKDIEAFIDGKVYDGATCMTYAYGGSLLKLIFNPTNNFVNIPLTNDFRVIANTFGLLGQEYEAKDGKIKVSPYEFLILSC